MEQKKTYTEPLCEVTRFAVEDIVATSAEGWDTFEVGSVEEYEQTQ